MAEKTRIFAVVNQKGGVGKTTTTITLAYELAKLCREDPQPGAPSEQVLIIDFDSQGNCAHSLGLRPNGENLANVLLGTGTVRENLLKADRAADGLPRPNLWLLPSDQQLAAVKTRLIMREAVQSAMSMIDPQEPGEQVPLLEVMRTQIGPVADRFAFVLIDCPPSHDAFMNAVYHLAQAAIVPVKVDYLSTVGAGQNIENIRKAQLSGINIRIHTVVPTFYVHRQVQDNLMLEALQNAYGARTVAEPIPRSQPVAEAAASGGGMALTEYAPDSPATLAYRNLAQRIYYG
ncbi:MAG: ParA family protein [Anaerolineales bacterium]|nr:ParA family protein [Anaerolineales bacterium]